MKRTLRWARALWRRWVHTSGPTGLWKIGYALTLSFTVAVAGLAALGYGAWALLHHPHLPRGNALSVHDAVGVAQLVFASFAGTGALVALVMAYRRQRVAETASVHDRSRLLNERFTAITAQLGDENAAVRLAGVHAMAGLADDWEENRQTCVDVLCAYLRLPYEPDPGDEAPAQERLAFRANREVRHTAIRVITAHLQDGAKTSWQGLNFDFTGAVFDGGSFAGAVFSAGTVSFIGAVFSAGTVSFVGAVFSAGTVSFVGAVFSGGTVSFIDAVFSAGTVSFAGAVFSGGTVSFVGAVFSGGTVSFVDAWFGPVDSSGGWVIAGPDWGPLLGGTVDFDDAEFSAGRVDFAPAVFSAGRISFLGAVFSGGTVSFAGATFAGCSIVFDSTRGWFHPPTFDFASDSPPPGVLLEPLFRPGSSVTAVTGSDTEGSSAAERSPLAGAAGHSADGSREGEHQGDEPRKDSDERE